MRSDDLVPLLTPAPGKAASYRQGVIVSWNPDTAENLVLVGGSLLTNLPVFVSSEVPLLSEGDVVVLSTYGSSWMVWGRVAYPGTPEAVSAIQSITSRIQVASDSVSGTRNSTSWGDLTGASVGPSVTIRIGSSGRALVFWGAEMGQSAAFQTKNNPHVGVEVSGATSRPAVDGNALNWHYEFPGSGFAGHAAMSSWLQCSTFHVYTGLNPGDTTFTMKYRHDTLAPAGAVSFNAREIAVFAL